MMSTTKRWIFEIETNYWKKIKNWGERIGLLMSTLSTFKIRSISVWGSLKNSFTPLRVSRVVKKSRFLDMKQKEMAWYKQSHVQNFKIMVIDNLFLTACTRSSYLLN